MPWLKIVVEAKDWRLEVTDGYAVALVFLVMAATLVAMIVVTKLFGGEA